MPTTVEWHVGSRCHGSVSASESTMPSLPGCPMRLRISDLIRCETRPSWRDSICSSAHRLRRRTDHRNYRGYAVCYRHDARLVSLRNHWALQDSNL